MIIKYAKARGNKAKLSVRMTVIKLPCHPHRSSAHTLTVVGIHIAHLVYNKAITQRRHL